jgi:hypothetical protein
VLLSCVLEETGLDFVRLSSGTYVLIRRAEIAPRFGNLAGQVVDAETGSWLADASVMLTTAGPGTITNRDGRFAFEDIEPGEHQVLIPHVAYHPRREVVWIEPDGQRDLLVHLDPRIFLASPVVVSGFETRLPSEYLGLEQRTANERELAPIGMPDIIQDLNSLVGVRLGGALSDVHVQGGAGNEQLFLLDGSPVFIPVATGGLIGPFSPYAIDHVSVHKAGYDASRGSTLSGVVEVEHRVSTSPRETVIAQVDPLNVNLLWNEEVGDPSGRHLTWMFAGRKSLWKQRRHPRLESLFESWATADNFLLDALDIQDRSAPVAGPLEIRYSDLHAAGRLQFGRLSSLRFSAYRGASTFGIDDFRLPDGAPTDVFEGAYRWSNRNASVRYERVQSKRLFLNATVFAAGYDLKHPLSLLYVDEAAALSSEDFNELQQTGLRFGWDLAATSRHFVSGAAEVSRSFSDFSVSIDPVGQNPVDAQDVEPHDWRVSTFLEDRISVGEGVLVTAGLRLSYLPAWENTFAEPRLSVQIDRSTGSTGALAVRGAIGLYRQFMHSFDATTYNVTALVPRVRFWMPLGRDERPPKAYHSSLAFLFRPNEIWRFGIESFGKRLTHLLVLDYGRSSGAAGGGLLAGADGLAYGIAASASRFATRAQVTASYEYSVARQRVSNRFDGEYVPVYWDAPHRFHLALDVLPLPHVTATLRWQYVAGRRWGFRQAYYDVLEPDPSSSYYPPFDLSDPASHRLPVFSQCDIGLAYTRSVGGISVQARASLINVWDRKNARDWTLSRDPETGLHVRRERQLTPFVPSLSLQVRV